MLRKFNLIQNLKQTTKNNFVSDIKRKVFHIFSMKQKLMQLKYF